MCSEECWQLLPASARTMAFRSVYFRVLSRLGSAAHQLVTHPHELYPQKLFLGLGAPETRADLATEGQCLKDPFTKQLQNVYPTLEGEQVQAILKMHALHQAVDIGAIETKHASVRRQIVLLSVQTWRREFSEASCHWLLQNLRCFAKATACLAAAYAGDLHTALSLARATERLRNKAFQLSFFACFLLFQQQKTQNIAEPPISVFASPKKRSFKI